MLSLSQPIKFTATPLRIKIFPIIPFLFLPEFGMNHLENNLNSHPYFANAYLFVLLFLARILKSDLCLNGDLKEKNTSKFYIAVG